jgi:hypothetical protein
LARRIDEFLASRGYAARSSGDRVVSAAAEITPRDAKPDATRRPSPPGDKPADFVCEDDVRQAIRQGRKIVIGERSIITPAARDLAEQHRLFVQASWPR